MDKMDATITELEGKRNTSFTARDFIASMTTRRAVCGLDEPASRREASRASIGSSTSSYNALGSLEKIAAAMEAASEKRRRQEEVDEQLEHVQARRRLHKQRLAQDAAGELGVPN